MPNSDGEIYSELRNGIKYGASVADAATVLGSSSNDVGTLCTLPTINPASLIKPYLNANPTVYLRESAYVWDVYTSYSSSTNMAAWNNKTPPAYGQLDLNISATYEDPYYRDDRN